MFKKSDCAKLNVLGLAFSLGIITGIGMLIIGILAWLTGWGSDGIAILASWYVGFTPTLPGSVVGGIWGFADGFIGGALIAWVYNLLAVKK